MDNALNGQQVIPPPPQPQPPPLQVATPASPEKKSPIFLIVSIGIFLVVLLAFIGMLILFLSKQGNKIKSAPAQNTIPSTVAQITPTPSPTLIPLKQQYDNPFDQKSQYKNPFEKSNNPFSSLSQ